MRQSICLDYFRLARFLPARSSSERQFSIEKNGLGRITSSCERRSRTAVGDLWPLCEPLT